LISLFFDLIDIMFSTLRGGLKYRNDHRNETVLVNCARKDSGIPGTDAVVVSFGPEMQIVPEAILPAGRDRITAVRHSERL